MTPINNKLRIHSILAAPYNINESSLLIEMRTRSSRLKLKDDYSLLADRTTSKTVNPNSHKSQYKQ